MKDYHEPIPHEKEDGKSLKDSHEPILDEKQERDLLDTQLGDQRMSCLLRRRMVM